ncbi:MAG: tetratricopeptide repeat protein [Ferruginibacter sp.]
MLQLPPIRISVVLWLFLSFAGNKNALAQQVPDSNGIKKNIQVCIDSVTANPAFTQLLARQTLVASNQIKYPWGVFMNLNILGAVACNKGEYKEAVRLHEIALAYGRAHHFRQKESITLGNLAKDHSGLGDTRKAIDLYHQAVKVAQDINDTLQVGQALQGLGQSYNKIGYSKETIQYCQQAAEIFRLKKRYTSLRWAYNNIASAYMDSRKFDSAYRYILLTQEAYNQMTEGGTPPVDFYLNMAICYDSLGKKDSAALYFSKAIEEARQSGDEVGLQPALFYLASKTSEAGNTGKAIQYYKEALQLTEKYNNLEGSVTTANSLAELYARNNDYANAYRYSVKAADFKDAYLNEEKIQAVTALNAKFEKQQLQYEFEKKATAAEVANQEKITRRNIWLYSMVALALLLAGAIFVLVKYFRQKAIITANRNNELKQQLLLTQMNPHFIFNSVDNIQSLIYGNQQEAAISYLTKFSRLTRQILENSRENYITLSEELNMLDNYLTIQQLLHNNKFTHSIAVDESIDPEAILLPPMLTQPFIENAIRHGLKDKNSGGVVSVRFYMKDKQLFFEVTDNGSGLPVKEKENGQRSLSTQITRERLQSLRPKENISIHTDNIPGEDHSIAGVQTFFEIPYIENN